jgi:hypothetical protein
MKKKGGKEVPNCVPSKDVPKAKGYKKVDESAEMVRYCPKCGKDETRSECRYGSKYWDMFSIPSSLSSNQLKYDIAQVHPANEEKEPDHEYSMSRSELSTIVSAAKRLRKKLKGEGNIEAWVQSKITKAADYIDAAADYLDSGEHDVHGSMDEEISPQIPGGKSKYKFPVLPKENPDNVPIIPLKRKGVELPLASKKERNLQVSNYNMKTFGEFMQEALDKSKMKCNSPKSNPVGDSLTGKSHVVKACEGGKEKIIRFGQRGVKGSPKKKENRKHTQIVVKDFRQNTPKILLRVK